jgi:HSP20 family protein
MRTKPFRFLRYDLLDGLRRFHEDFGDIIWDTVREVSSGRPPMNIWYDENKAVLEAELPGVKKEDLEIEVLGNNISLKGCRTTENEDVIRQERSCGCFSRNLQLPFEVNSEHVEASLTNGILKVCLPRKEADKPKKVQISVA